MLSIEATAGLVSTWDSGSGVLTLSGAAGVATYEAALRSAAYTNLSENPDGGPRVIGFVVSDGTDSSTTGLKSVVVAPVNDAPVITGLGTLLFVENQAAEPVAPGLLLADPDSPGIAGATIQIIGSYARGEDILAFVAAAGIVGAWDAESGTLTLIGPATLEEYAAALRSVTYSNTSDDPSTSPRTLVIRVTDGQDLGPPADAEVSISAVNDPPELTMTLSRLDYEAGGSPAPIDEGVRVTDLDNKSLVGATVAILANSAPGDELLFEGRDGIRGRWDAGAGVLTLSGVASVGAYQAALRSVRFRTAAETTLSDPRSVAVTVDDGAASVSAGRLVTVSIPPPAVATPPVSPPSPPVAPPSAPPPVAPPVSQPPVLPPAVVLRPIPPEAIPPAAPPAAPPTTPQATNPPSVAPPSTPQPLGQPQPVPRIVAEQASAPSTAASLHIDPASLAAAAGTAIQLIESPGVV
ncbi:MAG: hypothetical protein ABUU24_07385, partial [Variovorax sp.]